MSIYRTKYFLIDNYLSDNQMISNFFAFKRSWCVYSIETHRPENIVRKVFPFVQFELK